MSDDALRDPLTGLFGSRFLGGALRSELARAPREGRPLALILADIDRFGDFNARFGRAAGDALLRALGQALREATRSDDAACRYGGDLFALLLPQCTLEAARERAEALARSLRELQFSHAGQAFTCPGLSFGVAAYPQHGGSDVLLLQAADAALHRAKARGRGRVECAQLPARRAYARMREAA
jgi:diguanylate cyclase (GGDEF)-like protein